ncbi:MAG: STAS domain-containing protein [Planctomycetota bacterium]|nr:STAS domain-containing protein [Planctomycetota bacterium]MDA1215177.1 STAS domain-containing protein [Planctomycetota bacterium]
MSSPETAYRFENEGGHAVITLLPNLNDVPWADIERIGSDILVKFGTSKSPTFVVDLSSLNYMGSAMVALIVRLWKSSKERNGRMVVVNQDEMVLEVLKLAGLNKVWTIVDSRGLAIQALGGRGNLVGEDSGGGGGWIAGILGLISVGVSGFALYALLNKLPQLGTQAAVGLLLGAAALGLIFGLVAVLKGSGVPKVLGLLVMMSAVGLGVAGVMKMPAFANQAPVQDEGDSQEEGAAEDSKEDPATDRTAATLGPESPQTPPTTTEPPAAAAPPDKGSTPAPESKGE